MSGNITNTSNNADKINIEAGSNVTVTNQKDRKIGTINTGDNSNTTVNNRGIIDTINTGKDSSLTLNNYEGGQVGKIIGGTISNKDSLLGINVANYGDINYIHTGDYSTNEIFNYGKGYVDWLETGFGNASFHSDGFGNITGAGSDYNISKDKEGIDAYMVYLKKYIGQFGTLPQGKLDEIGKTLNKYKNNQGQLEYFIKELQATGKITVTQDKISGKYKVNNKEKTYYEIYYEQIMNTPNNSLYAINVPEEYGRFVFAAHKAGIPDQDIMGIEDWVNTNGPIWKATYNDRSVQATKEAVSIILGFTPVDIYKDVADLIAGKDIITGRESNRALLALCLISPEIFDKLLKCGLKQSDLIFEVTDELNSKGLKGLEYENYLTKNIGGTGSFKVAGREFDGSYGNLWWEAKSGGYWQNQLSTEAGLAKFKSDVGEHAAIAKKNGKDFIVFSNTPIPDNVKDWFKSKDILYKETK